MSWFVILVLAVGAAALIFGVSMIWGSDVTETVQTLADDPDSVRLDGEVMMMSHNGLHHAVTAQVTAMQGRKVIGTSTVNEDNTFAMQIPQDVRGEIEVSLGLHGGSVSLVEADGSDLLVTVMYNPVNNYFA